MNRLRCLSAATLLALATSAHATTDAEIRQWLNELLGSALVLQELAAGPCSTVTREEGIDVDAWYSWGAALGSPGFRSSAERAKPEVLTHTRARVRQWVAEEFRKPAAQRPADACIAYGGIFRTIKLAAEAELEDIEYARRGRVTPRQER